MHGNGSGIEKEWREGWGRKGWIFRNIKGEYQKRWGNKKKNNKIIIRKIDYSFPCSSHFFFTFSCSVSFSFVVYIPYNVHHCLYTGFIAKVLSYDRFPVLNHRSSTFLLSYQPLPPSLLTITPTLHSRSLHSSITSLIFPVGFFSFPFFFVPSFTSLWSCSLSPMRLIQSTVRRWWEKSLMLRKRGL